ncbi:putative porin [Sphingomonas sp. H39-1-10]|uniref:putative porin n=1 Tax=Sphingomonas pollutisoli TaxID=3030829 RepID=UPI0023B9D589|nr:putative porin [Sphingomonas pollutisoli]MDF0490356.1 putative porin [Sphingomonas pollutisoli]
MSQGLKVRRTVWMAALLSSALVGAVPALAQDAAPAARRDSAVETMVKLLIEEGIIPPDKAAALTARAQALAAQEQQQAPAATAELTPPPAGAVRVPYVPETVRAQIATQVRDEVMAQAKAERWAAPDNAAPDWVDNIRIHGDLRVRSASSLYSRDNATNSFYDVPAFNSSGPYDVSGNGNQLIPQINTIRDKVNNMQIRARIGIEATVAERFQLGFQLATGDDAGPISTNSNLTGGFRKRDVWIQNAYVRGELVDGVTAMLGRFDNPFRTTDLMFDPDLALDGVYGEVDVTKILRQDGFHLAVRGGAFPIQFEPTDFPSTSGDKRNWRDRYMFSGQVELAKEFAGGVRVDLSAAYHNFTYLRGHVSEPCDTYSATNIECSTDILRPLWASKGNTLFYLRRIDQEFATNPAQPNNPQYLGLKFAYRVLDVNGSVSVPISERVQARLTGSYLYNFGFDPENICREGEDAGPINNYVVTNGDANQLACGANPGKFVGGNEGYGAYFSIGDPDLFSVNPRRARRGAWAINAAYKYLQSDAVPDSFTDSDFHLGGTNAKGFILGGAWAPYNGITIGGRWLSASEIVGPPLKIDVLQIDLGVAF